MSRTKTYRTIAMGTWWVDNALLDDRKFTLEDLDETALAIAGTALIWKGDTILGAIPHLRIVEGAVVAGGIAAYAIGGVRGVENYCDFMTNPSKWKKKTDESLDIIYEEVIAPKVVDPLVEYGEKKIDQGIEFSKFLAREAEKTFNEGLEWSLRGLPSIEYSI